jgi:hypothetical protein
MVTLFSTQHSLRRGFLSLSHTHMHTNTHAHVHTYTHTHIHTYTHTHIHTYTHTHIHTYTHTDSHQLANKPMREQTDSCILTHTRTLLSFTMCQVPLLAKFGFLRLTPKTKASLAFEFHDPPMVRSRRVFVVLSCRCFDRARGYARACDWRPSDCHCGAEFAYVVMACDADDRLVRSVYDEDEDASDAKRRRFEAQVRFLLLLCVLTCRLCVCFYDPCSLLLLMIWVLACHLSLSHFLSLSMSRALALSVSV